MILPQRLTIDQRPRAVEVLASAFQQDPLWVYLFPDPTVRAALLPRFFRLTVTLGITSRQSYGLGDPLGGVATWGLLEPESPLPPRLLIEGGALRLLISRFPLALPRALPIFSRFEQMRRQYAPPRHYYLSNIGVHPNVQGKGIASKLIKPFLLQADQRGIHAYTETITPENVAVYEHFGFRVMEEYRVPRTDLRLWAFLRPPVR